MILVQNLWKPCLLLCVETSKFEKVCVGGSPQVNTFEHVLGFPCYLWLTNDITESGHLRTALWTDRQTDKTENITFMQLRWRVVINHRILIDLKICHPKLTNSVGYSLCNLRKQSTLLSHSFEVPVVHVWVFHKHSKIDNMGIRDFSTWKPKKSATKL